MGQAYDRPADPALLPLFSSSRESIPQVGSAAGTVPDYSHDVGLGDILAGIEHKPGQHH